MNILELIAALDIQQLDDLKEAIKAEKRKRRIKKRRVFTNRFDLTYYESREDANNAILKLNSRHLLEPPEKTRPLWQRMKYLPALLAQDWSGIYPPNPNDGRREFYVYAHVDPRKWIVTIQGSIQSLGGTPFYIGKGVGNRAFDLKRNQGHGKHLRLLLDAGFEPNDIVKVAFNQLTEAKAYEIEAKLICFFGTIYDATGNGVLMNLDVPKTPEWVGVMQKPMCRQRWNACKKGET
jgi:hypothetical protein